MNALVQSHPPQVSIHGNRVTTTSKAVAEYFNKQHKNVLQKIEELKVDCHASWYGLNFQPIQIPIDLGMGRIRQDPAYELTRDGFTLLAMSFTGKQALAWKIAYIEAFNIMEAQLQQLPYHPLPKLARGLQKAVNHHAWSLAQESFTYFREYLQRKAAYMDAPDVERISLAAALSEVSPSSSLAPSLPVTLSEEEAKTLSGLFCLLDMAKSMQADIAAAMHSFRSPQAKNISDLWKDQALLASRLYRVKDACDAVRLRDV